MATGTSLLLIALGAVLAFAVDYSLSGVDIRAIGAVLMITGLLGLMISLLFLASFSPFSGHGQHHDHA